MSPNVTTDWVPGLEGILLASSLTLLLSRVFTHCRHFTAIKSTPCRIYSRLRAQAGRSIKRILPRTTAHCLRGLPRGPGPHLQIYIYIYIYTYIYIYIRHPRSHTARLLASLRSAIICNMSSLASVYCLERGKRL